MSAEKELFNEMDRHLLKDEKPSKYFIAIKDSPLFRKQPFSLLLRLEKVKQEPKHHAEGNVWNHTMLVIDKAAKAKDKSSDSRAFMWGALLHDIGKHDATKVRKGKITAYDHDKLGAEQAREFLEHFAAKQEFVDKVVALVRWHMQILFVVKSLPFADIDGMKEQTSIEDIALLGLCDRLGRTGADREKEEENIRIFLEKCGKTQ